MSADFLPTRALPVVSSALSQNTCSTGSLAHHASAFLLKWPAEMRGWLRFVVRHSQENYIWDTRKEKPKITFIGRPSSVTLYNKVHNICPTIWKHYWATVLSPCMSFRINTDTLPSVITQQCNQIFITQRHNLYQAKWKLETHNSALVSVEDNRRITQRILFVVYILTWYNPEQVGP